MTSQTLTPDATSPARRPGAVPTSLTLPAWLRELRASRRASTRLPSAARTPSDRTARRAAAREIAAYPATRSAAAVVMISARSTA